jgi:hypothetical protein
MRHDLLRGSFSTWKQFTWPGSCRRVDLAAALDPGGQCANGKLGGQGSSAHLNFPFADQPSIQPSRKSIDLLRKVE